MEHDRLIYSSNRAADVRRRRRETRREAGLPCTVPNKGKDLL